MTAIAELRALLLETTEGVMPDMLAVETQLLIRVLGEYSDLKSQLRDERLTGFGCHVGRRIPVTNQHVELGHAAVSSCRGCGRVRCVCAELRAM